jgi:hypothetical protein
VQPPNGLAFGGSVGPIDLKLGVVCSGACVVARRLGCVHARAVCASNLAGAPCVDGPTPRFGTKARLVHCILRQISAHNV